MTSESSDRLACPRERAQRMNMGEWNGYERGHIRRSSRVLHYLSTFDSAPVDAHYRMAAFSNPR
jgi:hypothetical protein